MSIRLYEAYKELFNETKPIRGRGVEVRPWGDRRRDWEQVICRVQADGSLAYGARMHSTDVFLVYPNGDIQFDCDGWYTPTTAEFMGGLVLGIRVFKLYNRMWVQRDVGTEKFCALLDKPVLVKWDTTNPNYEHYRLAEPSTALQKTIDPVKAKAERLKIKAFKDYALSMLKISDGCVSDDLVAQYMQHPNRYWEENTNLSGQIFHRRAMRNLDFDTKQEAALFDAMQTQDPDEQLELFPHLLVMFVRGMESDGGRYDPKKVAAKIDRVITKYCDIHKYNEVVITKPIANTK
jgi:hypothetical protein